LEFFKQLSRIILAGIDPYTRNKFVARIYFVATKIKIKQFGSALELEEALHLTRETGEAAWKKAGDGIRTHE
jgi:hypothetical protein